MLEVGRRVVLELVGVLDRQELEALGPFALQEGRQAAWTRPRTWPPPPAPACIFSMATLWGTNVAFTSMPSCLKMIGPEKFAAVPVGIEVHDLAGEVLERC